MPQIEVRDLSLARGSQPILKRLSFAVACGEVVFVLGPSGSGKSTLLQALNRLIEPPPGAVFFEGDDITTLDVLDLRRRVGLVFQQPSMFPGTVRDNVLYGPALSRSSGDGPPLSDEQVTDLLAAADLPPEFIEKDATRLSGGEAQRVALARTLANRPEVLLADEPTSALDPIATRAVEDALLGLNRERGLTLVWVSHGVEQAERVGERALFLHQGELIADGPSAEVLDPNHAHPAVRVYMRAQQSKAQEAREMTS
jgi:ABC-type phosphate transport system ATPase subunit